MIALALYILGGAIVRSLVIVVSDEWEMEITERGLLLTAVCWPLVAVANIAYIGFCHVREWRKADP